MGITSLVSTLTVWENAGMKPRKLTRNRIAGLFIVKLFRIDKIQSKSIPLSSMTEYTLLYAVFLF
jgi:ABC-type transport system involved in cytochrome c biogenesis permease subunit